MKKIRLQWWDGSGEATFEDIMVSSLANGDTIQDSIDLALASGEDEVAVFLDILHKKGFQAHISSESIDVFDFNNPCEDKYAELSSGEVLDIIENIPIETLCDGWESSFPNVYTTELDDYYIVLKHIEKKLTVDITQNDSIDQIALNDAVQSGEWHQLEWGYIINYENEEDLKNILGVLNAPVFNITSESSLDSIANKNSEKADNYMKSNFSSKTRHEGLK